MTCTRSLELALPVLDVKKRMPPENAPMHIGGDVALLPAGSDSEWVWPGPPTLNDSLPATTRAPPVSFHPAAPVSKSPPGERA